MTSYFLGKNLECHLLQFGKALSGLTSKILVQPVRKQLYLTCGFVDMICILCPKTGRITLNFNSLEAQPSKKILFLMILAFLSMKKHQVLLNQAVSDVLLTTVQL